MFDFALLFNELLWVGCDKNGHLGTFVLGGKGPLPKKLTEVEGFNFDQMDVWLEQLPEITQADVKPDIGFTDFEEYAELSRKGFFAYDYGDFHGSMRGVEGYEPITSPRLALHVDNLSDDFRAIVKLAVFPHTQFCDGEVFKPEIHMDCVQAHWDNE